MKAVAFTFALDDAGWASATFSSKGTQVTFAPSYLSDALGDLIRAVLAIAAALHSEPLCLLDQRVEWYGEPAGLDLILAIQADRSVRLQIVEMPDDFRRRVGRRILFDERIDFERFARSVYEEAIRVLQTHGVGGYRDKWELHDFPESDLRRLERLFADDIVR